jgi:hypothetical protein
MKVAVSVLLAWMLVGCSQDVPQHKPDDTLADIEPYTEPAAPRRSDFVSRDLSSDYHVGILRYRQSLINYQYRLSEYINQLGLSEGLLTSTGLPCTFPYTWEPINLPSTPEPITRDPVLVNQLLSGYIRDLRRQVYQVNQRYAPCVK